MPRLSKPSRPTPAPAPANAPQPLLGSVGDFVQWRCLAKMRELRELRELIVFRQDETRWDAPEGIVDVVGWLHGLISGHEAR